MGIKSKIKQKIQAATGTYSKVKASITLKQVDLIKRKTGFVDNYFLIDRTAFICRLFSNSLQVASLLNLTEYVQDNDQIIKFYDSEKIRPCIRPYTDREAYELKPYVKYDEIETGKVFVAFLNNAVVAEEIEGVWVGDIFLSEFVGYDLNRLKAMKGYFIKAINQSSMLYRKDSTEKIERGILLTKLWSLNYWHFIIETISRLQYVDKLEEYDDYPLLIGEQGIRDAKNRQLIKLVNKKNRPIIILKKNTLYHVTDLIYVSFNSWWSPEKYEGLKYAPKLMPEIIDYIRNSILKPILQQNTKVKKKYDRVYVARGNQNRLVNENEVIKYFKKQGYDIVNPDKMRLLEEIYLFATANEIVAVGGGALTNIIFSKSGQKVYEICPLYFQGLGYEGIAEHLPIEFYDIDAKLLKKGKTYNTSTFEVAINDIKRVICATESKHL